MKRNVPSLDLVEFVETQIIPQYNNFDSAHSAEHVIRVIRNSLELVEPTGADVNMVYTIAAYHDLGLSGPRAIHHLTGGKILSLDVRLKQWFSLEQIKIMREAIEDHRASASHAPRSIYGKIVAEADRDLEMEQVFRRTIRFGLSNYSTLDYEGQWERFKKHLDYKYSSSGYIQLWIPGSPNERRLKELRKIISQPKLLRHYFELYFSQELSI